MSNQPATITEQESNANDLTHRFTGHWMMFDHEERIALSAGVHLWATDTECGFEMSDGRGGDAQRIRFDDKKIVWAMTCMIRLMRRQAYRVEPARRRDA